MDTQELFIIYETGIDARYHHTFCDLMVGECEPGDRPFYRDYHGGREIDHRIKLVNENLFVGKTRKCAAVRGLHYSYDFIRERGHTGPIRVVSPTPDLFKLADDGRDWVWQRTCRKELLSKRFAILDDNSLEYHRDELEEHDLNDLICVGLTFEAEIAFDDQFVAFDREADASLYRLKYGGEIVAMVDGQPMERVNEPA